MRQIERNEYLRRLIAKRENGFVKVITGVRRCGKSYLLFTLFKKYLLDSGVPDTRIVCLALDNILNAVYRDPMALAAYLDEKTGGEGLYYVLLDEIQYVGKKRIQSNPDITVGFYDVLNTLLQKGNVDIYVTGSNSKMLSKDVATEFRGRGDELHITPLTFSEFYHFRGGEKSDALNEYFTYGGLPLVQSKETDAEKKQYLNGLFGETYLKDILERHTVARPDALEQIVSELCSSVGSLTNALKIAASLHSSARIGISSETVSSYLGYLTDAFLFSKADRYDVKGRKYFSYPSKFYCVDPGLRNARLNYRQIEETHLMENVIYNELVSRGHAVDVGVVESTETVNGKRTCVAREIDFVLNAEKPGEKCYIQSALQLDSPEKTERELRPFMKLKNDFTRRIVITKTEMKPWTDEFGIRHIGIYDFLLETE